MDVEDDRAVYRRMQEAIDQLVESGLSEEQASLELVQEVSASLEDVVDGVFREVLADTRLLLRTERRNRAGFHAEVRSCWGPALDALYTVIYLVADTADCFIRDNAGEADRADDEVFDVLVALHERGRRVALEVHHLLVGGFAGGALARVRTLYELTVTGLVIGEYGRRPEHLDLARRYLDHEVISVERRAREYQASAPVRGFPLVPEDELADLARQRAEVMARHGKVIKEANGWAAPLLSHGRDPKFSELEELARTSHLRSDYQWMCGETHAGAYGLALNQVVYDGEAEGIIGPTAGGLDMPGRLALTSLMQLTWALLTYGNPHGLLRIKDLLSLRAIERFVARYEDRADECMQRHEELYQQPDR